MDRARTDDYPRSSGFIHRGAHSFATSQDEKADRDNRANQLNPNNDAYWTSRGREGRPEWDDEGDDGDDDSGGRFVTLSDILDYSVPLPGDLDPETLREAEDLRDILRSPGAVVEFVLLDPGYSLLARRIVARELDELVAQRPR